MGLEDHLDASTGILCSGSDKLLAHSTLDLIVIEKKKMWIINVAIPGNGRKQRRSQSVMTEY